MKGKERSMAKENDSFFEGLMKGVGRKLGERRRQVHESIERFHEELQKEDEDVQKEDKPAASKPVEQAPDQTGPEDNDADSS
jgi:Sec-independent protein translocase protein TatA